MLLSVADGCEYKQAAGRSLVVTSVQQMYAALGGTLQASNTRSLMHWQVLLLSGT